MWSTLDDNALELVLKHALTPAFASGLVCATSGYCYGDLVSGGHRGSVLASPAEEAAEQQAKRSQEHVAHRDAAIERMAELQARTDALRPSDDIDDEEPFATIEVDMGPDRFEPPGRKIWPMKLYDSGQLAYGVSSLSLGDIPKAHALAAAKDPVAWARYERAKAAHKERKGTYLAAARHAARHDRSIAAKGLRVCRAWRDSILTGCPHLLAHALKHGFEGEPSTWARVPVEARACVRTVSFSHPEHETGRDYSAPESTLHAETTRRLLAILQAFPRLQDVGELIGQMPAAALAALGTHAPNLRSLGLYGITAVLDPSHLEPLLRGCPRLVSIGINRGLWVDEQCLRLIARHCAALEQLTLARCPRVDAKAIKHLKGCKSLAVLSVSDATLSAAAFKAIGAGCPALQELDVARCDGFRKEGLRDLQQCKALRYLSLPSSIKSVPPELRAALPELQVSPMDDEA